MHLEVAVDYDDFSVNNHRFDLLDQIRKRYPDFKVTMFTVPWEIRFDAKGKGTPITQPEHRWWVDTVKQGITDGWLEIMLHGLTHAPEEFHRLTYDEAKKRILVGLKMFENVGIECKPYFKAPQWLISEGGKQAVEDMDLILVEDHYYNWNLKDKKPENTKMIAHGHIQDERGTGNGMEQSLMHLFQIPQDAEFKFLSDVWGKA